ncbi:sugar transferase [Shouchella clausii]|jgi:exopolysaccharide biosynthesis polyprenyl glycosylphosphotransferase|nr:MULTISPECIES: sugar transferase [Shouchella]MCM3313162.1 sugar transferase [Psychrobacillus sp. MER TA 17]ALA54018.1 sugar transferase [Shouchella clausii]KKI87293.1 sugar transferase [Shouchella clausii]MBU3229428.1 sugar transferase [Shouchella clausii]MBU3265349.1 sugar transferase [Shouchella clausii]
MPTMIPNRMTRGLTMLVDLLLIISSYGLAFSILRGQMTPKNYEAFGSVAPWILLISVLFLGIYELDRLVQHDMWDLVRKLAISLTFIMLLTMTVSFFFREFALPRSVLLLAHVLAFILLLIWKGAYTKYSQLSRKGKVMFIGSEEEFAEMEHSLSTFLSKSSYVRWYDKRESLAQLRTKLMEYDVVFLGSGLDEGKKDRLMFHAMKKKKLVYVVPKVNDMLLMNTSVTTMDDTMVMQVKPFTLTLTQLLIKRAVDIAASSVMLIATLPVMLLTAIAIKLEDGGPIFFKQERLGKNHQPFNILKFRSMVMDAEAKTGPTLAKSDDDRITKTGKFIRKTRIDELPQLINVLIGDMSLVGPRPERDFFAEKFQRENKWFNYRHAVKPGITGYAQVMGKYTTNVDKKLKFDLHYIRNYSFWLDCIILMQTILVVINKAKSEGEAAPQKAGRVYRKSEKVSVK